MCLIVDGCPTFCSTSWRLLFSCWNLYPKRLGCQSWWHLANERTSRAVQLLGPSHKKMPRAWNTSACLIMWVQGSQNVFHIHRFLWDFPFITWMTFSPKSAVPVRLHNRTGAIDVHRQTCHCWYLSWCRSKIAFRNPAGCSTCQGDSWHSNSWHRDMSHMDHFGIITWGSSTSDDLSTCVFTFRTGHFGGADFEEKTEKVHVPGMFLQTGFAKAQGKQLLS